jgi:hypothetical protein
MELYQHAEMEASSSKAGEEQQQQHAGSAEEQQSKAHKQQEQQQEAEGQEEQGGEAEAKEDGQQDPQEVGQEQQQEQQGAAGQRRSGAGAAGAEAPVESFYTEGRALQVSLPEQPYADPMAWAQQLTQELAQVQRVLFTCGLMRGGGVGPGDAVIRCSETNGQAQATAAADGAVDSQTNGGEASGVNGSVVGNGGSSSAEALATQGAAQRAVEAAGGSAAAQHAFDLARRQQQEYVAALKKEVGGWLDVRWCAVLC